MCLYVREIALAEGRSLQNSVRRGRDRIKVRRGQVILASAQGSKVPAIARRLYFSPQHVRTIIKDFNANERLMAKSHRMPVHSRQGVLDTQHVLRRLRRTANRLGSLRRVPKQVRQTRTIEPNWKRH